MSACVFLGPTLSVEDARGVLEASYLPPVRQGDVYRAVTRLRPRAVGIVDGYFHQVPSVWHKEILWAMSEGVHVFGSASMGALRAAELHAFGMAGVGDVFEAFRDGVLEDDDEVAVIHGPAETGFLAASEAMVNIRRTLAAAGSAGIIAASTRRALAEVAKSLFYAKRSYPALIEGGKARGLPADQLAALERWLDENRVDVKRRDALAMLEAMDALISGNADPGQAEYRFAHTTLWQAAVDDIDADPDDGHRNADRNRYELLLDELRLDNGAAGGLRQAAMLRLLARREASRRGVEAGDHELSAFTTDFRLERGLGRGRDLARWLSERGLDPESFRALMRDELLIRKLGVRERAEIDGCLVDQLRLSGAYPRLCARADAKRAMLAEEARAHIGQMQAGEGDPGTLRALEWYFTQRLGRAVPENMETFASQSGFEDAAAFRRAVMREYRYQGAGQEE